MHIFSSYGEVGIPSPPSYTQTPSEHYVLPLTLWFTRLKMMGDGTLNILDTTHCPSSIIRGVLKFKGDKPLHGWFLNLHDILGLGISGERSIAF